MRGMDLNNLKSLSLAAYLEIPDDHIEKVMSEI